MSSRRRFTEGESVGDKRERSRSGGRDRGSKPYEWGGTEDGDKRKEKGAGSMTAGDTKPKPIMSESMRRLMETMAGAPPPPPPGAPPPQAFQQPSGPSPEARAMSNGPESQSGAQKPKVSNAMARLLAGGNVPRSALAPAKPEGTKMEFKKKHPGVSQKGESWPFLPREKQPVGNAFAPLDSDSEDDEKKGVKKGELIYADDKKGAPAPAPSSAYHRNMPKELVQIHASVPAGVPPPPPLEMYKPERQSPTQSGGIKQPTLSASDLISGRNKQAGVACMQFKLGRCWYGAACKRVHEAPKGKLSAAEIYANHAQSFYQPIVAPAEPPPPPQGQH